MSDVVEARGSGPLALVGSSLLLFGGSPLSGGSLLCLSLVASYGVHVFPQGWLKVSIFLPLWLSVGLNVFGERMRLSPEELLLKLNVY